MKKVECKSLGAVRELHVSERKYSFIKYRSIKDSNRDLI